MTIRNAESDQMLVSIVSSGVVLVDYGTPWCPPCKTLFGILDELDHDLNGRLDIVKVNCENLPASASAAGVLGMPTVIVYQDGIPMDKLVGLRPKAVYQAIVEKYLY
ncbi:thioredoxin family protein [Paenibacillus sinopodophylli]|uniref:thioredoxin family protein n=1 Tax=Paenibacillus sinopodophylli TaxID=1837342 RepID=UPI00319E2778